MGREIKGRKPIIGITEGGDAGLDFSWYRKAKDCDGVILITKRLSDYFIEKALDTNCIIHATITGHGGTVLEPNVPALKESLYYFSTLYDCFDEDKIVLRIDPIIPTKAGFDAVMNVFDELLNFGNIHPRVRISFMDNYPHVKERFARAGLEPLPYSFHADYIRRKNQLDVLNKMIGNIEVCGEPGFESTGCVSYRDLEILDIHEDINYKLYQEITFHQRPECQCLPYKKELLPIKKQCKHGCLYCYWR